MKYLDQLKRTNTIPKIIQEITSIFKGFEDDDYIPAIIEEGNFTADQGEDFYLKLVLKHQSIEIDGTWLKDNMEFHLEEPTNYDNTKNNSAFIHNVITYRKYKSRNLYQLNPLLVSDEINEYEYINSNYVNAFCNDEYSNVQGLPVLKSTNNLKLLILKKIFNNYINDPKSNIYPKFELVAEFEYRTHDDHFKKTNSDIYKSSDAYIKIDRGESSVFVLGSIKIPLYKSNSKRKNRNIQVLDLKDLKPRMHNSSHYNGDTIEGFICFKPEVINILKEYYYFYDLQMVDKSNIENSYLVDVLGDKIVFWEAEYNKLPTSVKDEIDPFNFVPEDKKRIISEAMSSMQLEVDWNWDKKLSPEYLLANLIRERAFNRAIDISLTFIEPKHKEDLRDFILKIEALTGIKLERFNTSANDVKRLISIRQGSTLEEPVDLKILYQKYCYAIQAEYKK
ncbi:hypothetical protein PN4B1_48870 [Paenibacillus naphthalenovorans]|uniref:hypothetical protein n=1 Tax=Paenibacillus naphthalenovorans TaxID=162209 RepID=UPI0010BA6D34|nr:hypothetical protein [Paenibacillus naphthalenovorans]GCL74901.1 hypothetical protein PN4B1_48870 [Paenibacillus naphthalenovorans]